ncbi:carboxymuconolactone decarboxylase family protein [Asanoa siamensis]|uniref:Alkyl hydroperoxide reductase AhpD n=1 Tax=Asanoa siamensis TaxID=926357 RepID=A0ABQ4CLF0_9ACTN|nr:carboxymuconolactone decarboxylase family protein [Asanoa siamensis]GIF72122.1 alkyl hydroperoxide reductase AhpD [Asanoa siamensis]
MGVIMIHGTRRAAATVRHVTPVPIGTARGLVARVYAQVEGDFGMLAPPVSLHSPAPEVLAACWSVLRETLVAGGTVDRATKELVATAVSLGNTCPYCVDVHSSALHGLARGREAAVVAGGRLDQIADPARRRLAQWARGSGQPGGVPDVPADALPEVLGVAVVFHYINRMVNLFLPASPFPDRLPGGSRALVRRVFGRMMGLGRRDPAPGDSLALLPTAPTPDDLKWTAGSPVVEDSLARAAAAMERAGLRAVPASARALVVDRLETWHGEPPGPNRGWLATAVDTLPRADRPAGRLALLAAFASYQSTDRDIERLRAVGAGDREIVEIAAWAAMAAARRVGTFGVGEPPGPA